MGAVTTIGITLAIIVAFILGMMFAIGVTLSKPERFLKSYPKDGVFLVTDVEGEIHVDMNLRVPMDKVISSKVIIFDVHTQSITRKRFEELIEKEQQENENSISM